MSASPAYHRKRPKHKPQPRTSLSHEQVPPFKYGDSYTTAIGDNPRKVKVLEVTCGRKECGQTFIVPIKPWRALHSIDTAVDGRQTNVTFICRPCPFCFRVGRVES